jgi:hypothetical protein
MLFPANVRATGGFMLKCATGVPVTVIWTCAEVDTAKFESPLYTAVMELFPTGKYKAASAVKPEFSVAVPNVAVPFINVTVPVGVEFVVGPTDTWNSTGWFAVTLVLEAVKVTVEGCWALA